MHKTSVMKLKTTARGWLWSIILMGAPLLGHAATIINDDFSGITASANTVTTSDTTYYDGGTSGSSLTVASNGAFSSGSALNLTTSTASTDGVYASLGSSINLAANNVTVSFSFYGNDGGLRVGLFNTGATSVTAINQNPTGWIGEYVDFQNGGSGIIVYDNTGSSGPFFGTRTNNTTTTSGLTINTLQTVSMTFSLVGGNLQDSVTVNGNAPITSTFSASNGTTTLNELGLLNDHGASGVSLQLSNILVTTTPVPEPATWLLMFAGLAFLVVARRRCAQV